MTTTALAGSARAPVWCGAEVCWLDPAADRLRVGRADAGGIRPVAAYALDARPLSALPTRTGWLVATTTGVIALRRDGRQSATPWPPATLLSCDPGGRLWLATPDALLRADLSGRLRAVAAGPTTALAWHPDATTAYRATPTGIDAHPYDLANGLLGAPTPLSDDPATALAVDHTGQLWAAVPAGIRCVGPTCLTIPTPTPTGCCFTADALLVTTPTGLHPYDTGTGGHPTPRFSS
ncbi:SMP-30/gluconolactonase/LRE family protein [Actinokineospora sp. 24-640]